NERTTELQKRLRSQKRAKRVTLLPMLLWSSVCSVFSVTLWFDPVSSFRGGLELPQLHRAVPAGRCPDLAFVEVNQRRQGELVRLERRTLLAGQDVPQHRDARVPRREGAAVGRERQAAHLVERPGQAAQLRAGVQRPQPHRAVAAAGGQHV